MERMRLASRSHFSVPGSPRVLGHRRVGPAPDMTISNGLRPHFQHPIASGVGDRSNHPRLFWGRELEAKPALSAVLALTRDEGDQIIAQEPKRTNPPF